MDRYQTPAEVIEALAALALPRPEAPPVRPAAGPAPATPVPRDDTPPATPRVEIQAVPGTPPEQLAASVYHWGEAAPKTPPTNVIVELEKANKIAFLKGHAGCVMSLAFAPNRETLASGGVDCRTRIWEFSGKQPHERSALRAQNTPVHAMTFSPDSHVLATGSGAMDGLICLWNMREEQPPCIAALQGHQGAIEALVFAADGKFLASASGDKTVRVWETAGPDFRSRCVLKGHTRPVKAVAFSPDNKTVASAGEDCAVRLWNPLRSLWSKELAVLEGHRDHVSALAFSPDGRLLASAGQDQCVILWDLGALPATQTKVLRGNTSVVGQLVFTPDGQGLISAENGRQVIQWDVATGKRLRTWQLPDPLLASFAFTVDGRYLAAGTAEGPVAVYRLGDKKKPASPTDS
jgi:WD40 repeat protein